MRAEEFDNLTEEELQRKANSCFIQAENTNVQLAGGESERHRLLLEAQFYLTAVGKKRDDRTAQRDLLLEYIVIVLISVEIILSVVFGFLGLHEGAQQSVILNHMDDSTRTTATAMNEATTVLKTLNEEQKTSSASLEQMNHSLQDSLKQTGTMASATHKQLGILQEEQANRLAQQSKKPKYELYVSNAQLDPVAPIYAVPSRENDTSDTFVLRLMNSGNATAHKAVLRARLFTKEAFKANDIFLTAEGRWKAEQIPLMPGWAENDFFIQLGDFRPSVAEIIITFTFPKGQPQFQVRFSLDADEVDFGTTLGDMFVSPRKVQN